MEDNFVLKAMEESLPNFNITIEKQMREKTLIKAWSRSTITWKLSCEENFQRKVVLSVLKK